MGRWQARAVAKPGIAGYDLPYWLDFERPTYPALTGNHTTDVVVVGAGISGLKVADYLTGHGLACVILEARQVGQGASSRNQGCIVTGLGSPYGELVEQTSRHTARSLVGLSHFNQKLLCKQIESHGIACDYEVLGETGLAFADLSPADVLEAMRRDARLLTEDGFRAEFLDADEVRAITDTTLFHGGLRLPDDAQFHSGRFVIGLGAAVAREASVFEGSPVISLARDGNVHKVCTPHGVVRAEHLFIATNALVPQLLPALTTTLRAERGQVLVTEPLPTRPCSGCYSAGIAWWRDIREADGRYRLLFGGGRFRDDADSLFVQYRSDGRRNPRLATAGFSPSVAHQHRLERHLAQIFPHLAGVPISHRWGGLQSFTYDGLPVIGLLDPINRIHGMAGFSGLGNSFSNVGAACLAARIAGTKSEVEERFGDTMALLLAPTRESAAWPGSEPTKLRSDSGGLVRLDPKAKAGGPAP